MFNRQYSDPSIMGYVDADYTRDLDDRRSTTGYLFTLGGGCWKSMAQSLVALSTIKSKHCGLQDWLRSWVFNKVKFNFIVTVKVLSFQQRTNCIMQGPNT